VKFVVLETTSSVLHIDLPTKLQLRQQKNARNQVPRRTCMRLRSTFYMRLVFSSISCIFVFISAKITVPLPPTVNLDPQILSTSTVQLLLLPPANATMSLCYARQTFFLFLVLSFSFFNVYVKQFFWNVCFMVFFFSFSLLLLLFFVVPV